MIAYLSLKVNSYTMDFLYVNEVFAKISEIK